MVSISFPGFPFENDSVLNFRFGQPFNDSFGFPNLEELQKQLQEKFKQNHLLIPDFKTPEQQKEWQELMQKQQKDKDDLKKKF